MLTLSINPWYYCNFKCNFCYLTKTQLDDNKLLPINLLVKRLAEITSVDQVNMVDLYGGELGLLPKEYWAELIDTLHAYRIYDINLITNLSMVNEITEDERVYISVSYDFDAREDYERVWRNMALLKKPFSILMLASPDLIKKDVNEMVELLNTFDKLVSVEIKPYSTNQANQLIVQYDEYEEFVKKWVMDRNKKFILTNEFLLQTVIDKKRNSFSDDHVYITPSGKYGVLDFDLNDNEFFLEYETLEEYFEWCTKEKIRVTKNKFCSRCDYCGNCLSEHLRDVKSLDNSCNGFKHLIDWYGTNNS